MQKRFCPCGRSFEVQYDHSKPGWRVGIRLYTFRDAVQVGVCPSCGRLVHIDTLT